MRPLFLLLLLLNVLFFFWQTQWQDNFRTEVTLQPQALPHGVERLALLREQAMLDEPQQKDAVAGLDTFEAGTKSGQEARMPAEKTEPDPLEIVASIPSLETSAPETPKAESVAVVCFSLGPFTETTVAEQAAAAIRGTGILIELRQEFGRARRAYWVYLPSAQDFKAAGETVTALQAKGIKDLYIMGNGVYENAISLGLFRAEAAAQVRFKQIQDLGFAPVLGEQFQDTAQQWLEISVPGGQATAVDAMKEIAARYPDVNLEQKACE